MREPYRTLFEGYADHWLLGQYLYGDEPDWEGLEAEDRLLSLSSGEMTLVAVAGAFAGDRTCRFSDLAAMDAGHRRRVARALLATCDD